MKKLKAVFVCAKKETVDYVYSEAQRKQIAEVTDLMPEIVNAGNFDSVDLKDVEVIFSTWGMMCFTDEQLDRMPNLKAVWLTRENIGPSAFCTT